MFTELLRTQASGLVTLMQNQPTTQPHLMKEAIDDVATAVAKAEQAAKKVDNGDIQTPTD